MSSKHPEFSRENCGARRQSEVQKWSISAITLLSISLLFYVRNFKVQRIENEDIFAPREKEDCKGFLRLLSCARPTYKDWKLSLSSIVPILRPYQVSVWKCFCLRL